MRGILGVVVPPLLAWVLAGKRKNKSIVFWVGEYLAYMAIIAGVSMLTMVPLERISLRVDYVQRNVYLDYGYAALAAACLLGVFVGAAARWIRAKGLLIASIEERGAGGKGFHVLRLLVRLVFSGLMVLLSCYCWALSRYGNINFEEMIFHLRMPLAGTADSFVEDLLVNGMLPGAVIALALLLASGFPAQRCWLVRRAANRRIWISVYPLRIPGCMSLAALMCMGAVMLMFADQNFTISEYIGNQIRQSRLIEEEYVDPDSVRLTFPQKKRNLITIYVESAETASQDRENGGFFDVNYIPEMTRLASEHVSFSHSEKLEGAAIAPACGWTIAGLVAQTAGLPLKLYKYDDLKNGVDNAMEKQSSFFPGAVSLGDILRKEGYRNIFMCGSDATFGGRRLYFQQHGEYEIWDHLYAQECGRLEQGYYTFWGFEDEKLYSWAKDTLVELAQDDQPFNLTLLTVDTHAPDGYTCRLCPDTYDDPFANILACSSRQLDDFVAWCQTQDFYENTSIVVTGDHASMAAGFYEQEEYDKHGGSVERRVYNVIINSAVEPEKEKNRLFTTMDFFPTTLASLGVSIEGERLGLGTNLFSDTATLAEKYGYERFFDELSRKSVFYNEKILYP